MQFEFATAGGIVFGWGSAKKLTLSQYGSRALLVTGRRDPPLSIEAHRFSVVGEPTVELVRKGVDTFRTADATWSSESVEAA